MKFVLAHVVSILCFFIAIQVTKDFIYLYLLYLISFVLSYKLISLWITNKTYKEIKTILARHI